MSKLDEGELAQAIFDSRTAILNVFADEAAAKRAAGKLDYDEEMDRRLAARYATIILATLRRNRRAIADAG